MNNLCTTEPYTRNGSGILLPFAPVSHREDEYDPAGFGTLLRMQ